MTKVHGKRYAYKFDFHGLMAACQAQAQGGETSAASMISAASYSKYHPAVQSEMYAASSAAAVAAAATSCVTNQPGKSVTGPPPPGPHLFAASHYWPYSPPSFDPRPPTGF